MATQATDSNWHKQISNVDEGPYGIIKRVYWLKPFKTYTMSSLWRAIKMEEK